MIERADQLVLDFVSRVADAAHGRMRPEQRLDYVLRLREQVEAARAGSENPKVVLRILTGFGTPQQLVEREVRRLAGDGATDSGSSGGGDSGRTRALPSVLDQAELPRNASHTPPGVMHYRGEARRHLAARAGHPPSVWARFRRRAMAGGNPMATGGRDAWSIFANHGRETAGIGLLVLAALLVPFQLPPIAIFPVSGLFWAAGAVVVLAGEGWGFNDRLIGLAAPAVLYLAGGGAIALARAATSELGRFLIEFHAVSGVMFIIGTAGGVGWLIYRLFDPPPPPPTRSLRVTR